ncbi:MAG TPA: pyrroline-5-carboxylate reductase [Candidatus Nitrosotenuis sp.]|nr:pyrroline-5-carboxylate reductase [Candidatus Nitrosotenuis sp.]
MWENLKAKKYAFVGGGIIAGVFIERLLKSGVAGPQDILASDVRTERLEELRRAFHIRVSAENHDAVRFGDVVFIAVPPPAVKPVLTDAAGVTQNGQLFVSLAAAVTTQLIEDALGKPLAVLRVIPNTPSLLGAGMNPFCFGRHVAPEQKKLAIELLSVFGSSFEVHEPQMSAATALTAVGPTYFFPAVKALMDAAVAHGLTAQQAQFAAAQTMLGAARMVLETGKDPETLKMMIGTRTLDEAAARSVFTAALDSAFAKISEMEQKLNPVPAHAV